MDDLQTTITVILAFCGGITAVYTCVDKLSNLFNPYKKFQKETNAALNDHAIRISKCEELLMRDYKHMGELDEANRMLCRCLLSMMDYLRSENKDVLESAISDLQSYLIERN